MANELNHIIWSRFKQGDNDALAILYKNYAHELYAYGLKIINDENLVKDSIQEVFIHLIGKRESLQITSTIHVYLFKSLRNKIFEESRSKHKKQDILKLQFVVDEPVDSSTEEKMIESEEKKSNQVEMKNAIHKLTERQQEVIFLKYTEDFDYEEIADLLNIDIASVRTLVYRSLKSIKNLLAV